jgi:hypothetical protein
VTELTQPHAGASAETITVVAQPSDGAHAVSFSELVYAHFDWWRDRQGAGASQGTTRAYDAARRAFEHRHGEIVSSYWCSQVESAVALTEKKRLGGVLAPTWGFHRESDWATQNAPDVAAELHRCDELAVRANAVLSGVRKRICMQLVVASAAHLLSLVDARASNADEATTVTALNKERAAIRKAEAYYKEAANGQAQMVYFGGMAAITLILSIFAAIWLALSWATPVAALIAGAVAAVVSVIQRITSGRFALETDVGGYPFFLGGLRPLIGGAFAIAISFAFTGGLLHLPVAANESTDHRRMALVAIGFIAGFSERWAQDTLTAVMPATRDTTATATTATATVSVDTSAADDTQTHE